jgi:hypothetical protein
VGYPGARPGDRGGRQGGDASDRVGADGIDLLLDRDGVLRDVGRELCDLRSDRAADAQDDAEGHDDGQQNGWHSTEPRPAQQLDNRREQEESRIASVIGIRISRAR